VHAVAEISLRLVNTIRSSAVAVLINNGNEVDLLYAESIPAMRRYVASLPSIMSQINFIAKMKILLPQLKKFGSQTVKILKRKRLTTSGRIKLCFHKSVL